MQRGRLRNSCSRASLLASDSDSGTTTTATLSAIRAMATYVCPRIRAANSPRRASHQCRLSPRRVSPALLDPASDSVLVAELFDPAGVVEPFIACLLDDLVAVEDA